MSKLINKLRKLQIDLTLVEGELKVSAPAGTLTNEIVAEIRCEKEYLKQYISESAARKHYRPLEKAEAKEAYQLSSAQQRLFFLHEMDRTALIYNMPFAIRLKGKHHPEKLNEAFNKMIDRHESLRTSFVLADHEPVQKIAAAVPFTIADLGHADDTAIQGMAKAFVRPFNLGEAPLMRAGLIHLATDEHILLVDMHHIISDGISQLHFKDDFIHFYNNEALPALPLQYRDYAVWQQTDAQQENMALQRNFWLQEYAGEIPVLELPVDFARPRIMEYKGDSVVFELDERETIGLKLLAGAEGATMYMTLLSVFNVLLGRLSGQEDVVVGAPAAGRFDQDLQGVIGMFVNTLALRNFPAGHKTFREFLGEVKVKTLDCLSHQLYPYEMLIDALKPDRDVSRNPLFDVMFSYNAAEPVSREMPGVTMEHFPLERSVAMFDLTLTATESNNRIILDLEFCSSLFRKEKVQKIAGYFRELVAAVLVNPDEKISALEMLPAAERYQLLHEFNNTSRPYRNEDTFVSVFEDCVRRFSQHTAVVHNNESYSYHELNELANRIASFLQAREMPAGKIVPLLVQRSIYLIACMIGIQKAGYAFLAIDTRNPASRVEKILTDCQPMVIIAAADQIHLVPQHVQTELVLLDAADPGQPFWGYGAGNLSTAPAAADLAYCIYTSGSTGEPKGVLLHHQGMVNHFRGLIELLHLGEADRFAQTAECSFDIYVVQALMLLITGGCTHIVDREDVLDPQRLALLLQTVNITLLELVPSMVKSLVAAFDDTMAKVALRWFITCGEKITTDQVAEWYRVFPEIPLVNAYGPAETSDDVTAYIIPVDLPGTDVTNIPIGKPLPNIHLHILNQDLKLCPVGVKGEICIAGIAVGKGYWNNSQETKRKFVDNPYNDKNEPGYNVIYRTGDIGYWLEDGNIAFLGRNDSLVKVRGARIETGEVEKALLSVAGMENVVVLVAGSEKLLCAWFTATQAYETAILRQLVAERLPDYMIPQYFIRLEKFPLTINGKVDKKALPLPAPDTLKELIAPQTAREQILHQVWRQVLRTENIGVTDNFFLLGGDSIKSIQIKSRLRAAGYDMSVKDLFTDQTIRGLAKKLKEINAVSDQLAVTGRSKLTPIQQRHFDVSGNHADHYNQSVLLNFPIGISGDTVRIIFQKLQEHHDALRMIFVYEQGEVCQENLAPQIAVSLEEYDWKKEPDGHGKLGRQADKIQAGMDLGSAPLVKLGLFHLPDGSRLLIVVSHLVIDGVSWRILFEDIATLYRQVEAQQPLSLPLKTDAFLHWRSCLQKHADSAEFSTTCWKDILGRPFTPLPCDFPGGSPENKHSAASFLLNTRETASLLTDVHMAFTTRINDLLLTALMMSVKELYGISELLIELETHGRDEIQGANVSRTVGWFTSLYPVRLSVSNNNLTDMIRGVKETLKSIPDNGRDYLIYKYLHPDFAKDFPGGLPAAPVSFNYLGQFDDDVQHDIYSLAQESRGRETDPERAAEYEWDIIGQVVAGQFSLQLNYNAARYRPDTISKLMTLYKKALQELIAHCTGYGKVMLSPSDITCNKLPMAILDVLQQEYALVDVYTLSPMQEGILFHFLLNPGSDEYFEQTTLHIEGQLDIGLVQESMNCLMDRYDVLRTIFLPNVYDRPLQVVLKERKIDVVFHDIRGRCGSEDKAAVIAACQQEDRMQSFDLASDVLMRLTVLRTDVTRYTFIWSHHHIIMDGWCIGIIMKAFREIYTAKAAGRPVTLVSAGAYAVFIRWLEKRNKELAANYWKQYLDGYEQPVTLNRKEVLLSDELPCVIASGEIAVHSKNEQLLNHISGRYGVTLYTILQVAWGIVLSKYNNTEDVVFGSVVSGRSPEIDNVEDMVGLFINTVPVRIVCRQDDIVCQLLQDTQRAVLEAAPHHHHPLSAIQSECTPGRNLFNHIMVFENYPIADEVRNQISGDDDFFRVEGVEIFAKDNYDLSVSLIPGKELIIRCDFNSNVYDPAVISGVLDHYAKVLEQIAIAPEMRVGDIEMIAAAQKETLLHTFNDTAVLFPDDRTIVGMFEEQAARMPLATAVVMGDAALAYGELNGRSNQLAHFMKEVGVAQNDLVIVFMDKAVSVIEAVVGIWKAGAAFVPVVPSTPEGRLAYIIRDVQPRLVITQQSLLAQTTELLRREGMNVPCFYFNDLSSPGAPQDFCYNEKVLDRFPLENMVHPASGDDLAYMIYTSGSTGIPKAVAIQHKQYANAVYAWQHAYKLREFPVNLLQMASIGFDVFMGDIGRVLPNGGKMVLCSETVRLDFPELASLLGKHAITVFESTPALIVPLMEYLYDTGADMSSLRLLIIGSDICRAGDFGRIMRRLGSNIRVINSYGLTETTIDTSYFEGDVTDMPPSAVVPIGRPMANMTMYVLDKWKQLQPVGVPGDIYIGGSGVGRYYQRPQLNRERFIDNPFAAGEKMYKTGDLGKWLPDGNLQMMGRQDDQVKINGYRIETGEVEKVLSAIPEIEEALVMARREERRLYAYFKSSRRLDPAEIRDIMAEKLPDYMIPQYFIQLATFPLTANGKIDKKALPGPAAGTVKEVILPQSAEEKVLHDVWKQVLRTDPICVTDNFFSLGGDSIRSIQIRTRLRSTGYDMAIKDIFAYPSIRQLARRLSITRTVSDQAPVTGKSAVLSPIQRRHFLLSGEHFDHNNQSVLLNFPHGITADVVRTVFGKVQEHHDALRMKFTRDEDGFTVENLDTTLPVSLQEYDWRNSQPAGHNLSLIAAAIQSGMKICDAPLMKLALFHLPSGSRLLIVISHLVVDGVSWRILFEDMATLYHQVTEGKKLALPPKTDAFLSWPAGMQRYIHTPQYQAAAAYWKNVLLQPFAQLKRDFPDGEGTLQTGHTVSFLLGREATTQLLTDAHKPFNTGINDLLLAALMISVHRCFGMDELVIELETHGRDEILPEVNISRTVGWFTGIYPVVLSAERNSTAIATIRHIKEILRGVPDNGKDYPVYRYLDPRFTADFPAPPQQAAVSFNYLGQFDSDIPQDLCSLADEPRGEELDPLRPMEHDWDISGQVVGGQLTMQLIYSTVQFKEDTINGLMSVYRETLESLISCCLQQEKILLSPSDLSFKKLPARLLDELQQRYEMSDAYLLSPMQEGMLLHALMQPESDLYFEQMTLSVAGELNVNAVEESMNALIDRYDILRTLFLHNEYERPLQIVLKERKIDFLFKDVRQECRESGKEKIVSRFQEEDRKKSFDFAGDVLMRLTVLHTGANEYSFIWSHHHIIMDGWCMGIIIKEFRDIYDSKLSGRQVKLLPAGKYARFIEWLHKKDRMSAITYWQEYLAGFEALTTLPQREAPSGDHPPYLQQSLEIVPGTEIERLLHQMSVTHDVTLYTILQVAWGVMLSRYNNTGDVVFGSVVSGRSPEIEGIEDYIGLFINTVPVRINYEDTDTISDLLKRVQENAVKGEQYHHCPLSEVQAASGSGRNLLDHILIFENYPVADEIQGPAAEENRQGTSSFIINGIEVFEKVNYDLYVTVFPGKALTIRCSFNAGVYDPAVVGQVLRCFKEVLKNMAANPAACVSDINMLPREEEQALLHHVNNSTNADYPATETLISLFEAQVARTPDANALLYGTTVITYRQLDQQSNQIAAYLLDAGIEPGSLAGVMLEREALLIPAVFGILKAGGAYVPIDPHYPAERINAIVKDAGLAVVITRGRFLASLPVNYSGGIDLDGAMAVIDHLPVSRPQIGRPLRGTDPAYVIYTSGSTGIPKGVTVEHHGVINRLNWIQKNYPITAADVLIQKTPVIFDVSVGELFWWAHTGASLYLPPPGAEKAPDELMALVKQYGVTVIHFVPSMLGLFLGYTETSQAYDNLKHLKLVMCSGEELKAEQVALFGRTLYNNFRTKLINLYGPTEASIEVSCFECTFTGNYRRIPIGMPIDNIRLYILDSKKRPVPYGVPGELHIAGKGLARGYLNNPDLTAEKFTCNACLPGERMYASGDLARWLPDGNIAYLGRIDNQVKIRGYRIESEEIENRLLQHEAIREAVVTVFENDGDKYLVAYYVSAVTLMVKALQDFLMDKVPAYMVPAYFVHLPQLPLTSSGKLDRKALPAPLFGIGDAYTAPANETERKLAAIWAEVLKKDAGAISTDKNFFELGGHSIKAFHVVNNIRTAFAVNVGIGLIFEHPTIRQLARLLSGGVRQQLPPVERAADKEYYVTSAAQERLFYLQYLHKQSTVHNVNSVLQITGEMDIGNIRASFRKLIERHDNLKTNFFLTMEGVRQRLNADPYFEPELLENFSSVEQAMQYFIRPFNLSADLLIRVAVVVLPANDAFLLVDIHHIVCDALSLDILISDFVKIYRGEQLPPVALRYLDYAEWQRSRYPFMEKQKDFWTKKLSGELCPLNMSLMPANDPAYGSYAYSKTLDVDRERYLKLKDAAATLEVSPFMFLAAVCYVLLSRMSGQSDILLGTDVTGRTHEQLSGMVGTFVNVLPLRMAVSHEQPFRDLLREVRECVLEALENQDYQFNDIVNLAERGNQIIEVHFAFENIIEADQELNAMGFPPVSYAAPVTPEYGLHIAARETDGALAISFITNSRMYEAETLALMISYYDTILHVVLHKMDIPVGEIVLQGDAERTTIQQEES
nr:non-ribosomal peptide synthetase [uncultured Chitinophaga sp.]